MEPPFKLARDDRLHYLVHVRLLKRQHVPLLHDWGTFILNYLKYQIKNWTCVVQTAAVGRDKDWWASKTNPSFPSAPIADYSATTTSASTAAAPKQNPFLKGGSQEDTRVRDAPLTGDGKQRQTGDKNPRKDFEAGLKGAVSIILCLYGSACTHYN